MNFTEHALTFMNAEHKLVGVLGQPEHAHTVAVVIIVGGPQYRAGSHRQFVHLARALAEQGYPVLRFDVRGMGDSEGTQRDFEGISSDIGAAVDALLARVMPGTRVVLWGLCDAASAALLFMLETRDRRVAGLALANPWVRSAAGLARTQVKHYYTRRLMHREFWGKLFRGRIAAGALSGLASALQQSWSRGTVASQATPLSYQERMAQGWQQFAGPTLLLLSGDDYTAREFVEFSSDRAPWPQLLASATLRRHDLPGADHTFSTAVAKAKVAASTLDWLRDRVTVCAQ